MVRFDPAALLGATSSMTIHLLGTVVAVLAIVAIADYLFQYRTWYERQKMSLQEIKEEFKQSEGDPHIKGRLRQLRAARMKKRMMAAVPKASVIITNPTHYSVALQYERGMAAPLCLAKGADLIAFKIRESRASMTSRSSRTWRWRARSTPPSRSTRRFRSSTTTRSLR
jgi:flagellar biosynthetic protein FlhB